MQANSPCELLEWDTNFFGFRIGKVVGDKLTYEKLREIENWCKQENINCLYFLATANDYITTQIAEGNGFRFVDFRMTFAYRPTVRMTEAKSTSNHVLTIRPSCLEDIPFLLKICEGIYEDSRFFYDKTFPRHLSQSLYEVWITKSCEGYADIVFVAMMNGIPKGYVTCNIRDIHMGQIGLLGVSSQAQGHRVGETLVMKAVEWFLREGADEITVTTQGRNIPAQRLYQCCGFLTQSVQNWYHKWYHPITAARE